MSLHDNASITNFAQACAGLWQNWVNPPANWNPNPGDRRDKRRHRISSRIIHSATNFMVKPHVVFQDVGGSNGSFGWSAWRLRLKKSLTANSKLTYTEFVTFCRTMYHETRHAEQFYRIAQGLAAGTLKYPDKSDQDISQELNALSGGTGAVGGTGGVATLRSRFETVQGGGGPIQLTAALIAKWLNIPNNVAAHAYNAGNNFAAFTGGIKPDWFRRKTIQLEVEEWMRATYKGTLSDLNGWTQGDDGPYKMYRDQPEEHDAHEIGNRIVAAIDAATGVVSGVVDY